MFLFPFSVFKRRNIGVYVITRVSNVLMQRKEIGELHDEGSERFGKTKVTLWREIRQRREVETA
jgi:hypothetical protein